MKKLGEIQLLKIASLIAEDDISPILPSVLALAAPLRGILPTARSLLGPSLQKQA